MVHGSLMVVNGHMACNKKVYFLIFFVFCLISLFFVKNLYCYYLKFFIKVTNPCSSFTNPSLGNPDIM